ncbi:MAG TPA: hypothetical protein VN519_12715 [Bryobacteraceae bacterium]|nr:hypothetical protein [Bryobacteraceae bacterium]
MSTYEPAELVLIGTAEESILGIFSVGFDADYTTFADGVIYMDDTIA